MHIILILLCIPNYISGDKRGRSINTAAVAAGVIVPLLSMVLFLGTGITVWLVIYRVKCKQPQYYDESKFSAF